MRDKKKYFHACATQRKRENKISQVQDIHGNILRKWEEIEGVFNQYFQTFFTSSDPSLEDIDRCLTTMQPKVSNAMNKELEKPYSSNEMYVALKQMSPLKSLDSYSFSVYFFKLIGILYMLRYVKLFYISKILGHLMNYIILLILF